MLIYACSDLHVNPERFSPKAQDFLREAAERGADYTLFCGDIFEGTRCDLEKTFQSSHGEKLLELIDQQKDPILIRGNHDWTLQRYLEDEALNPYARLRALKVRDYWKEVKLGDKWLYATHGWAEYDRPFGWFACIYHRIVPTLSFMADVINSLSPGALLKRAQKREGWCFGFWERFYLWQERRMSSRAILAAREHGCVPLWGHTHRRHVDAYEEWLAICCGDFIEDDIVVIEDDQVKLWEPDGASAVYDLREMVTISKA
jgi:UDP-2,3-diacylglucosamine pyrophosphatase LpxH